MIKHIPNDQGNPFGAILLSYENPVGIEGPTTFGYSHLLEHLLTESTLEMEETYSSHGLTSNAWTSDRGVLFFLSGLSEYLDLHKEDFIRRVTGYVPTQKHLDKQRPIVLQEWNDHYQNPFTSHVSNFISQVYGGVGPIGLRSNIEQATLESVQDFHKEAFWKPTQILSIGGESVSQAVRDFVLTSNHSKKTPFIFLDTSLQVGDDSVTLALGSPRNFFGEEEFKVEFIAKMLSFSLRSPLMRVLREELGLCYWITAFNANLGDDENALMIATSVSADKLDHAKAAIQDILRQPEKYLTQEVFDMTYSSSVVAKKMTSARKEDFGYTLSLIEPRSSIKLNLEKITYPGILDFYKEQCFDQPEQWIAFDAKSLKEQA